MTVLTWFISNHSVVSITFPRGSFPFTPVNSQNKKHNKEKKDEKCYANSLARMELTCVLRERLMSFVQSIS